MTPDSSPPATVDAYIAEFPPAVQAVLQQVRATIRDAAPGATEKLSYRMPSYHLHGALVYFGGFKKHIGLYPPVNDAVLKRATARFAGPKGNLQFPLDEPMPLARIGKLVKARVREDTAKFKAKAAAKVAKKRRP